MARPHASRACAMALARPRGELGHIRPKLPSCMARSRPLLTASARFARPRDGLDGNDNGANSDDEHTKDRIFSRLYTCAQRTVPSSSVGCANAKDTNLGVEKSMRKAKKNIGSKNGLEKACKSGDFTKKEEREAEKRSYSHRIGSNLDSLER
ncbi:hypothetical protein PIB30_061770 [Stylosanthes scabra]|uniref:Uncharacterized protein n=1 Tax=Stylosanthes scabra TaxID=79078 RepID=A0ABU6YJ51_9FABA|nr:hypothetical protein [Stylosanthes scabra]